MASDMSPAAWLIMILKNSWWRKIGIRSARGEGVPSKPLLALKIHPRDGHNGHEFRSRPYAFCRWGAYL
jgi:hypothetical protein